jgi:hypothetical protein
MSRAEDCIWNVMPHVQKPDFLFRRNGRVHLNRRRSQFSRILAAEVCASAVVMLDTPCSEVVWRVLATHYIPHFPLHFPSCASSCAITFQLDCTSAHPCMPSYPGQEQLYVSKFSLRIGFSWRVSRCDMKFTVFKKSVSVPVNKQLSAPSCNYTTPRLKISNQISWLMWCRITERKPLETSSDKRWKFCGEKNFPSKSWLLAFQIINSQPCNFLRVTSVVRMPLISVRTPVFWWHAVLYMVTDFKFSR